MSSKSGPGRDGGRPLVGRASEFQPLHCGVRRLHFSSRSAAPGTRIAKNKRKYQVIFCTHLASYIGQVNSFFFSEAPPESRKAQCFFLDPETIENLSIYFDPKKTSRIVIKRILNYYHHGEKCGKLLVGMSEKSKRVSEK